VEQGRLMELERRLDDLTRRLEKLEGGEAARAAVRARAAAAEPPVKPRPVPPPARTPRPERAEPPRTSEVARPKPAAPDRQSLEDLLAGRVLAWVGGVAVLLGIAFLFAVAVSRGWIGEAERTLLAAVASTALLGLGVWLHERKARTDAALASVAAGIAGLFITITVAAQVYELVPSAVGVALALAVAVVGTALAVRWDSRGIGALGIIGALASPLLAGAPSTGGTVSIVLVAGASAVGVLLWRRWDWLALAVFALATPQWVVWLFDGASLQGGLAALIAFGALGVAAAVGYELRAPSERLRLSSSFLLALNALVVAVAGWYGLTELGSETAAKLWLAGVAGAHLAVGLASPRLSRVSDDMGLVALSLGVVLADVAYAAIVSGPALAIGWAGTAVVFAALLRHRRMRTPEAALGQMGLGGHLMLCLLHAAVVDAPPSLLVGGDLSAGAAASIVALAAGCFVSGRLADEGRAEWRVALDTVGLAAVAYLTALSVDGVALTVAWSLEAVVLAKLAERDESAVAPYGSVAFLSAALLHGLATLAPPQSLVYGLGDPAAAALGMGAVAAGALACAWLRVGGERWTQILVPSGAVTLLYVASTAIVTPFQPGAGEVEPYLLELGVRQQGQVVLSVFWSVVGVVGVVVGLRRDLRPLRLGALGLLLMTVGKVFLFDLATLTSVYRVVSFIGLGLLLLVAAFVWQRMRPRPLDDLRTVPKGVR
jgi:uncharacterized membrane protein